MIDGGVVWLNGRLLPRAEAMISAFDRGVLYGYGLFETMRAYKGVVFHLAHHRQRLLEATTILGIGPQAQALPFAEAVYAAIDANGLQEARIRVTVTAGEGTRELGPPPSGILTMLVEAVPLIEPSPETYERGLRAVISMRARRDSGSPATYLKSTNWIGSLIAQAEAQAAGVEEALLLNEHGYLAEGTASNVFVVRSGVLETPSVSSGLLRGTTRDTVLHLAGELGIPILERLIAPADLLSADEAFITSAIRLIMPLREVDGQQIGSGAAGEMTRRLMGAYRELVEAEVARGR